MPRPHAHRTPKPAVNVSGMPSSPGDSPVIQTPKDVFPDDAAARDITQRNVRSDDPAEKEEALLDDAIELSFPASDPIAVPAITKVVPDTSPATPPESEQQPPQSPAPGRRHRSS